MFVSRIPRFALVLAAVAAVLALSCGTARATDYQYFPVTSSPSILAPTTTGSGAVMLQTSCSRVTRSGWVRFDVQTPVTISDGLWVDATVFVRVHGTSYWTLALVHRQTYVPSPLASGGVVIGGYTEVVPWTQFFGSAGYTYDVAVNYAYHRPGYQWSPVRTLFQTLYVNHYTSGALVPGGGTTCWL